MKYLTYLNMYLWCAPAQWEPCQSDGESQPAGVNGETAAGGSEKGEQKRK